MIGKKLSRIILFVADMNKMKDFYTNVFGLKILDDSEPGFIILDAGASQIALHQIPGKYTGIDFEPREDSFVKMVFHSDNVEQDRAELKKSGVRMKKTFVWKNTLMCDGFDPEGNVFQISGRI
jgi:predicted enzyme related to lactoylglutathione lyase